MERSVVALHREVLTTFLGAVEVIFSILGERDAKRIVSEIEDAYPSRPLMGGPELEPFRAARLEIAARQNEPVFVKLEQVADPSWHDAAAAVATCFLGDLLCPVWTMEPGVELWIPHTITYYLDEYRRDIVEIAERYETTLVGGLDVVQTNLLLELAAARRLDKSPDDPDMSGSGEEKKAKPSSAVVACADFINRAWRTADSAGKSRASRRSLVRDYLLKSDPQADVDNFDKNFQPSRHGGLLV